MKYGNTLKKNIEPEYSRYYIPYNSMKKNIKMEPKFFVFLLNRYCEIAEDFYIKNKEEKELVYFCLLNVFSILKITKKYNKKNVYNITDKVRVLLLKQTFYKDLINQDFFFKSRLYDDTCNICYDKGNYKLRLNCCGQTVCWNCLLRCYINNYNKCNYCRVYIDTNPIMIALNKMTKTENPFYNYLLRGEKPKKLLMIGIDGLRPDAFLYSNTPNLDKLLKEGVFNFETTVESDTISGPSWASIMTGKSQQETNVYSNETVEDDKYQCKEDIFTKLNGEGIDTISLVSSWPGMKNIVKNSKTKEYIENISVIENDYKMIEKCERYLLSNNINDNFIYLYLNGIDHIGHKYGFTIQSEDYISCIESIDKKLKNTIEIAIENDWSVLVTTDHGGCRKTDLEPKKIDIFDSIFFVSGQVKKRLDGIHGLDIPQHTRTFKLLYGDIVNNQKREIMGNIKSIDTYNDIIGFYNI